MILDIICARDLSPQEKYGLLLLERSVEERMKEEGITDFGTKKSFFDKT